MQEADKKPKVLDVLIIRNFMRPKIAKSELFFSPKFLGSGTFFPKGYSKFQYGESVPAFLCWKPNIESDVLESPNIVIYRRSSIRDKQPCKHDIC